MDKWQSTLESMEIKKVLVTGSEGYIGSTLVEKLLDKEFEVIGLDTVYFNNSLNKSTKYKVIQCDIRDINSVDLNGIDAIIHLAALSNDPIGELDPKLTIDINYKATLNLAKKAKLNGVKKFIFSSSCSIYGTSENGIVNENSKPNPLTEYAVSKIKSEESLKKLADNKFQVHILRNATVYGYSPNFRDDLVVNNLTASAHTLGSINILSDGTPWRPLIDVRDLSDIFILFLDNNQKLNGEIINVGFAENNVQVKDIVSIIAKTIPSAKIKYLNERPNDKRSYKVDFSKFKKHFPSAKQQWTITRSIKDLVEAFQKNKFKTKEFKSGKYTRLKQLKELLENKQLDNKLYWNKNIENCRSCGYKLSPFFSLGNIPLVNSFLSEDELLKENAYDLTTAFCENCYLVQLTKTINPTEIFTDYIYKSGTSKLFVKHSKVMANHLTKKLNLKKEDFVLEIASNDGTQLSFYKESGMHVLGVDPAKNIAKIANKNGIKTIPEFFSAIFAKKLLKKKGVKADLIYGANVLAHVPQIIDFVKGVKIILAENGTAVFEFPYLKGLLENKFDTIYHEHVFYYSLIALKNIFSNANLIIYNIEHTEMQGGSLLIYVGHPEKHAISENVKVLVDKELTQNYHKLITYRVMNKKVTKLKSNLLKMLKDLKKNKKSIAAYSAPAKGIVLLNYFGIGNNYLDFVVDKAKEKQGLYTPGNHMKVYPIEKVLEEQPDFLIILCWNIADEVIKDLELYAKRGGKFIIPIPSIKQV